MMDTLLHIIGACGDTHSHFDIIDFLMLGGTSTPTLAYVIYKFKISFKNVRRVK